ncbi:acyltransferase family protein [Kitasatospora sp. NPDC056138]|uniref:acyltransferase family protein n=1 Tax=Kitasatospora sp. NPDC056138 TaxID=3345724 RepID=UPI0035D9D836
MTVIEQHPAKPVGGAVKPPTGQPVLPMGWLDALRGVAALLVAVHHFGLIHLLPYGGTINRKFDLGISAVMLFFLVSGYIVPASLERRGDVRGFWIGRIYPLLIVVITVALLVLPRAHSAVPDVVLDHPLRSSLANVLLLHEMLNGPSALGAMWTLCAGPPRLGSLVLGGLGAVLLFLNARSTFFESMTILATMFAGTAVHRIERGQLDRLQGLLCCGFVLVSGVLAGVLYDHGDAFCRTWTSGWEGFSLPYAAAWATFGLGMLLRDRRFPRVPTWLGAISYSVYVVHIPVLHAVDRLIPQDAFPHHGPGRFVPALIFLAAVLLLSDLTHRLVELLGQRLGRRLLKTLDTRSAPGPTPRPRSGG